MAPSARGLQIYLVLYLEAGDETQVLGLAQQVLYQVSFHLSPSWLN